jgi:hypothetical protein
MYKSLLIHGTASAKSNIAPSVTHEMMAVAWGKALVRCSLGHQVLQLLELGRARHRPYEVEQEQEA